MSRLSIRDFSNIYNPKLKAISSRAPNPNNLSPSPHRVSPRPVSGKTAQIANIPHIEEARKISRLKLSKEKISEISYSLSIDEASKKAFRMRMRTDQQYLPFDRNPLSDLTQKNDSRSSKPKSSITILQAMDDLGSRDVME
jgi:hypothetical protein